MQREGEKEWYYGNKEKERLGPFSFKEVSNDMQLLVVCIIPCTNGKWDLQFIF